ncbi:sulfotransferase [Vallicoccus soli]|uniref:Sulfotransferase n=1 Tax=Vallicoccus soli TaxID=2339232 RepID=A0A3A3Z0W3_9ACTN|nr:sulfotransferase [Vallicoccus soli]RJK97890.1 sulfotransferase [Vallicoccus soli]
MTGADAARRPTVLYIAGAGRSGSTLLERMLGAVPGLVNVGELVDLFRRVKDGDELCGCGRAFSACPFWTAVGERAFGGWTPALAAEFVELKARVGRQRDLPQLLAPTRARAFQDGLERYGELHRRVYDAVLAESGAHVVVDASKGVAHALAFTRSGQVDVRLLHLVRDARGVAFSWAKAGVARPQAGAPGATMSSFSPELTAARWTLLQGEITMARRLFTASTRVRYEDLVRSPARVVGDALTALGLPPGPGALAHIDGNRVDLPVTHGLSGNPSRFRSGVQELRADEQWRRDMSRRDRIVTTAIAAAPLTGYGYVGPRERRPS